ncbi:hypothetical protein A0J61_10320 [Choanephora cucurbitarum]|uniref:Uncharacterized protein n=1 Tax=Choanephora cucurbitarum TaxID=101091 RepID=A0A1C7MXS6_9FUNG|nr:hypothetical protein A0J61_10320 [Choanephora cucurbitarum]
MRSSKINLGRKTLTRSSITLDSTQAFSDKHSKEIQMSLRAYRFLPKKTGEHRHIVTKVEYSRGRVLIWGCFWAAGIGLVAVTEKAI